MSHADNWDEEHSRQGEQPVQRPWGRAMSNVFEDQEEGQWGSSGVSKGQW